MTRNLDPARQVLSAQAVVQSPASASYRLTPACEQALAAATQPRADLADRLREVTCYHQAGFRRLEAYALSRIGKQLARQNQPTAAIAFYKQALSLVESVRRDLQVVESLGRRFDLPPGQLQRPLVETFAKDVYRPLADLLLQQDRVWEAQQVLDLLKIEELRNYLNHLRGTVSTSAPEALPPEQTILSRFENLQARAIQVGKELAQLQDLPPDRRTPEQQQQLITLVTAEQELNRQFNTFIDSPDVVAAIDQLSRAERRQNINLEDLNSLRGVLRQMGNAVLLYPLILEDRLELVLTTADAPPIHRTVRLKRAELNRAIAAFRSALAQPDSNTTELARQFYLWLIQPIATDLTAANTQTIIYAPDGPLRYIPLAALYDGQGWLVQRYRINNITARSLTNLAASTQVQLRILAAAFVQGQYNVQVGSRRFDLQGLPFADKEVQNLQAIAPDTTLLVDQAFTPSALVPRLNDFQIIHLATHAAFLPGQPEDSFILFGNGDRVTLRDIETWSVPRVNLVVLSACETGMGGQLGNGEEILGLGYQFQRAGAKAAIASLWSVHDGGTQVLMNAFYGALKQGMSKAEALRQAQIALITGNFSAVGGQPGRTAGASSLTATLTSPPIRLNQPFYWAPFILIGNGL